MIPTPDFFSIKLDPLDRPANLPEYELWCAALHRYADDVVSAVHALTWPGGVQPGDRGEAYRDFKSPDSPILHRLCDLVDLDFGAVWEGIRRALVAQCAGGTQ